METPLITISKFIDLYENDTNVTNQLFYLLEAAMMSKYADEWTGDERSDQIFFCRQLSEFIRAAFHVSNLLDKYDFMYNY